MWAITENKKRRQIISVCWLSLKKKKSIIKLKLAELLSIETHVIRVSALRLSTPT